MLIRLLPLLCMLVGCTNSIVCTTYKNMNNLNICTGTQRQINNAVKLYIADGYERLPEGNAQKPVLGFYVPIEHKIYTVPIFDVLMHELHHAGGNLEEPVLRR